MPDPIREVEITVAEQAKEELRNTIHNLMNDHTIIMEERLVKAEVAWSNKLDEVIKERDTAKGSIEILKSQTRLLMWMLRTLDCGDCSIEEVRLQRRKVERLVGIFPENLNE
jgi:hypothetical protein